jgi:hypothetical protein
VYPGVAPEATTEADPFALPQVDCTNEVASVSAVGSVTVIEAVIEQPFASVMVQV